MVGPRYAIGNEELLLIWDLKKCAHRDAVCPFGLLSQLVFGNSSRPCTARRSRQLADLPQSLPDWRLACLRPQLAWPNFTVLRPWRQGATGSDTPIWYCSPFYRPVCGL